MGLRPTAEERHIDTVSCISNSFSPLCCTVLLCEAVDVRGGGGSWSGCAGHETRRVTGKPTTRAGRGQGGRREQAGGRGDEESRQGGRGWKREKTGEGESCSARNGAAASSIPSPPLVGIPNGSVAILHLPGEILTPARGDGTI